MVKVLKKGARLLKKPGIQEWQVRDDIYLETPFGSMITIPLLGTTTSSAGRYGCSWLDVPYAAGDGIDRLAFCVCTGGRGRFHAGVTDDSDTGGRVTSAGLASFPWESEVVLVVPAFWTGTWGWGW